MSYPKIDGIVPIIPTPFNADETINEADLRSAVKFAGANGASGVCLPAYASEFYKLSDAEREQVVTVAIEANNGAVPVIAQANHPAAVVAARTARRYESLGADMISIAVPRIFGLGKADILRYLGRVADAVSIPLLVQDYNPGGPTIGHDEIYELRRQHGNVRYVKLEEAMMAEKVKAIVDRVGDDVGVLEGWGGMYMLELIPAGICGVMPGLPILEPLAQVFKMRKGGRDAEAFALMGRVLPWINYTLQHFEVFLHVEKKLLQMRGIFQTTGVRDATTGVPAADRAYVEFLCEQTLNVVKESARG